MEEKFIRREDFGEVGLILGGWGGNVNTILCHKLSRVLNRNFLSGRFSHPIGEEHKFYDLILAAANRISWDSL
jgi:hypothetical protein